MFHFEFYFFAEFEMSWFIEFAGFVPCVGEKKYIDALGKPCKKLKFIKKMMTGILVKLKISCELAKTQDPREELKMMLKPMFKKLG